MRLREQYPNAVAVVLPVHASWLNPAEIYFSIPQRKLLAPNDLPGLDTAKDLLLAFGRGFSRNAETFNGKFTRKKRHDLMAKLNITNSTPKRRHTSKEAA